MRKPVLAFLAPAVGLLAFSVGAPAATGPVGAASPLRMTVGTLGSIGRLDPRYGNSAIAREVWNIQYPTLTALDPKTLDTTTGVANAWTPAPNGHGWIYSVRSGLAWTDGTPVTASDIVYSLDHARDERWPYAIGMLDGLSAHAVNARTVEITSTNNNAPPAGLLLHVVPARVFQKSTDVDYQPGLIGAGAGAWHIVALSHHSVTLGVLGRPAGPPLDQIEFRSYPNANALIDALAHRQVDVVSGLPDADIGRLEGMPGVTVDHAGDGTQYTLRDAAADTSVRQAISLAIDRGKLVSTVVHGVGTPGVVPAVARGASWALDDATVQSLTAALDAQPVRAVFMLPAAPSIDHTLVLSIPADPISRRVGAFIVRALAAVGVQATTVVNAGVAKQKIRRDLTLERVSIGDLPNPAITLPMLKRMTAQATVVGLFEPDVLQAFRTDHVTGFLPRPEQPSLVVFGPTVQQYGAIVAAPPPPGEASSNTVYAVGAAGFLALCAVGYWIASKIRRRYVM